MGRASACALAAAVLATVLSGCSNDGEAVGGGVTSEVETPVPNAADLAAPSVGDRRAAPERLRPLPPDSLALRTRGAALDFAGYVVEVVNHVTATGDVQSLQQIAFSACRGCMSIIEDVRLIYAQGGWSRGGEWSVLSSRAVSDGRHNWDVTLKVHAQRQRVKRSSSAPVEFVSGGRRTVQMSVARTEDTWLVTALTVVG